jgi:NTE family protein
MSPMPITPPLLSQRALVLHGGGSAGNAWEIGVIAGLYDAGLDVTAVDLIVGTSAGATVAAQITGAAPTALLAGILNATPPPHSVTGASGRQRVHAPAVDPLERTNRIIASASDAGDMRRRMGAAALELDAAADETARDRWRATVAARLPSENWPAQQIVITAVDARTGEAITFDRGSGVHLVDAVAASTSSGAPYRIGENRYIDGGYRRNENADLALGYGRVLVLSPFGGRSRHPLEWGMHLAAQIDELVAGGSSVETVFPDEASRAAFGDNMMDLSARPAAARAGYEQGSIVAPRVANFWEGALGV